jgi:ABC-type dipeptide/oligopeptide/nickel transport system permease component
VTRGEYLLRRLCFAVATVFIALSVNFFIFRAAPGNPTSLLLMRPNSTASYRQELLHRFGLDRSLWSQYVSYMRQIASGNFGVSTANSQLVTDNMKTALLNTLPMVILATVIAIVFGLLIGVLMAWARGTALENGGLMAALVAYALPTQWVGLLMLILFAGFLPTAGMSNPFLLNPSLLSRLWDELAHMILPATTLALGLFGQYALVVRSSMLDVLGEDYFLTARAKGNPRVRLLFHHGLRNALLPLTSLTALSVGSVVGGAVLVEIVFSWPGIGRAVAQAVTARDYPMLQGTLLLFTISVVACNFLADVLAVKIDPRVTV